MKIKLTEITEITEETIFEEAADETEYCAGEELDTPLDGGYREWKERRKREKLYGADSVKANIAEELVYLHLQNVKAACALLR